MRDAAVAGPCTGERPRGTRRAWPQPVRRQRVVGGHLRRGVALQEPTKSSGDSTPRRACRAPPSARGQAVEPLADGVLLAPLSLGRHSGGKGGA